MSKTLVHNVVAVAILVASVSGCGIFGGSGEDVHGDAVEVGAEGPKRIDVSDGKFSATWVRGEGNSYHIVAITNLNADVTSVDLRRFGSVMFDNLVSKKLAEGSDLNAEDEDALYFCMDVWVGTMNDITTYVAKKMRPDSDYQGVPDDFEDNGSLFVDVKQQDMTDQKRIMSAIPREELRRVRSLCAKNMGSCELGQIIGDFGKDFWDIPLEAFIYQLATVQGEMGNNNEKRYLEPNFGNLWGMLRTNDRELAAYVVRGNVTHDRLAADKELKRSFEEMDKMVERVREALDSALSSVDNKKRSDILRDVYEEFGHKNKELKGNLDLIIVDMPVAIYTKIALNEIDKAKGFVNDSEKEMVAALKRFHARTEHGRLVARVRSGSTRAVYRRLVEIARDELGDNEVKKILGKVW